LGAPLGGSGGSCGTEKVVRSWPTHTPAGDAAIARAWGAGRAMKAGLAGRRALVTGAASGIGAAIASEFQAQGATVLGLDLRDGGPVRILQADLANIHELDQIVDQVLADLGGADVLVNCAGTFEAQAATGLSWTVYDRTLRINLHAPVFLMSRLGRWMADNGYGRIVNITSIHGKLSEPLSTAYDVSKAGLEAAIRTFALELARSGVLVNAIAPGFVSTAMSIVGGVNELESDWFQSIYVGHGRLPLGRAAAPGEIATVATFLASEANSYLTGQTATVDGGLSARF
jgi:NAD(P)-dependent dehydrogenase (short-subunit alcohol dehydrogenase family)